MFSRSSLLRFTPWQFALDTVKKSHDTLSWPTPESSCKILFDTPDMPPKLKLILYSMLRTRHLLICTPQTTSQQQQQQSSLSPIASTFKAYASALTAASDVYRLVKFSREEFPLVATLNGDEWFVRGKNNSNVTAATASIEINQLNHYKQLQQPIWIPLPLQKAKKSGGKYQSLMQPKVSSEFAEAVSTGARDETTSKTFGGYRDRNPRRRVQNFMEQEKVQPSKQVAYLQAISSVSRIRFAETPSLVAEVWSNVLSDGIFDSMRIQVQAAVANTTTTNNIFDKSQEPILVSICDVLSSLFSSRDHLLFNDKTLDQVTSLALELLTCLHQHHLSLPSSINEQVSPKLAFAFSELCAHLSASLRIRGGCTVAAAKMSEFLLLSHHLSLNEARYRNVFRHVSRPNEKEIVLPLKICFELVQVMRFSSSSSLSSSENNQQKPLMNFLQESFAKSIQVVREEEIGVKERREKNFEERLQEIAVVADALVKNPNSEKLLASQQKHELHLKETVLRDKEISKRISLMVEAETAKIRKILSMENDEKKLKVKQSNNKSGGLDFYWSWNVATSEEGKTKKLGLTNEENINNKETQIIQTTKEKEEFDVDEDYADDGTPSSKHQGQTEEQEEVDRADISYASIKPISGDHHQRSFETWIVTFHKSDIARKVELESTPSLPSSQLLFLRWLLQTAQHQDDKAPPVLSDAETILLEQRRRLFFTGKYFRVENVPLFPTPSLESLFENHLYSSPSFSRRTEFAGARKQRTFSLPAPVFSNSSSTSSSKEITVEVIPFLPSVFEVQGQTKGRNAQEMIMMKICVPVVDDVEEKGFDISELLNQRLGVVPSTAVLSEIEYSGGEIVMVSQGMNEVLSI